MRRIAFGLVALLLAGSALAIGRPPESDPGKIDPAVVRIDEAGYLGKALDPATPFRDANGQRFTLGEVLGKPVILVLSYYGCDGSCPVVNQNLAQALEKVTRFRAGRDYRVLTVSFDRADTVDTAAQFADKLRTLSSSLNDGWRVAVLGDAAEDAPSRFAGSAGVRFFWSRLDKTFLHPNAAVFLTPEGRVARYIYGTSMDPRTLELALIDADWGRISESASAVFDMITGACFSYNFSEGRYQPNYALFAGLGSLIFGLSLMGLGAYAYRRKLLRSSVHAH